MRTAEYARDTTETKIAVSVDLDGSGAYDVKTGVGFFDHMLEQLARHSLIDIKVRADGDLHIDDHHTVEDVGIALGRAVQDAFGDGKGVRRYGACLLPMDDALTRCALDFPNGPTSCGGSRSRRKKIGTFDTELVREFFTAFAMNAGLTLHIETLYGENSHHIAESCFKSMARSLREALETDPRKADASPSTKGTLG